MDRYIREIPHDDNNDPRFDFPVRPTLYLDREARRLYYLYKFSP